MTDDRPPTLTAAAADDLEQRARVAGRAAATAIDLRDRLVDDRIAAIVALRWQHKLDARDVYQPLGLGRSTVTSMEARCRRNARSIPTMTLDAAWRKARRATRDLPAAEAAVTEHTRVRSAVFRELWAAGYPAARIRDLLGINLDVGKAERAAALAAGVRPPPYPHERVMAYVRGWIRDLEQSSGSWPAGSPVPAPRELAAAVGVTRMAVTVGLRKLLAAGELTKDTAVRVAPQRPARDVEAIPA